MPRVAKRSASQAVKAGSSRRSRPNSPLPLFVPPQLSQPVDKPPSGPQWVHEIKLDGYRMAARIDNGRVQLLTRTGLDWTAKYPSAVAALANLNVKTAYIDGELCGVDDAGLPSFAQTQAAKDGERGVHLVYYAFDLLHLSGWDNLEERTVFQDAREVRTKNRKTFTSTFFPVGSDIEAIVVDWISFLTKESLFGPDDALFPATRVEVGKEVLFGAVGLNRVGWRNATAIRRIFQEAFERADLPYFNPHSFRKTLAALGEKLCQSPEEFKAWSQNIGHEKVLTTFISYGSGAGERQADILNELSRKTVDGVDSGEPDETTIRRALGISAQEGVLDVSSQTLMAHSYRVIRRTRYGTDSTRERHNNKGGPCAGRQKNK